MKNKGKIYLFDIVLVSLILMSELPRIYFFSQMDYLNRVIDYLQFPMYIALICIIAKKKYTEKQFCIITFLGVLFLIGYVQSGQAGFLRALLLILASKNISFSHIVRICRYTIISTFILSVSLWIVGISNSGIGRRNSVAIGYVHPNIAGQVIMIIVLLWVVEKEREIKRTQCIIIETIAILLYVITGSKTSTLVVASLPVVIWLIRRKIFSTKEHFCFWTLVKYSQILIMIFTIVTAKFLAISNILQRLDLIFTNRLFLNYYALKHNEIKLFGQNINLQGTENVYNEIRGGWNWVITVDCSYVIAILIMGLIPTVLFFGGYVLIMNKAIQQKNYFVISGALLLAIYGFFESQLVEIFLNFVYFYILASTEEKTPINQLNLEYKGDKL